MSVSSQTLFLSALEVGWPRHFRLRQCPARPSNIPMTPDDAFCLSERHPSLAGRAFDLAPGAALRIHVRLPLTVFYTPEISHKRMRTAQAVPGRAVLKT